MGDLPQQVHSLIGNLGRNTMTGERLLFINLYFSELALTESLFQTLPGFTSDLGHCHIFNRYVEDEEDGCDVVRELGATEEHLPDIADVANLGVLETEAPEDQRGILDTCGYRDRDDHSRDHSQHGE